MPKPTTPVNKAAFIEMATRAGAHYVDQAEFDSMMARITGTARGHTPVMEDMRDPWNGRNLGIQVDRYDRNPLVSYPLALGSGTPHGGTAPQMFEVGGDLPPFTASGLDPIQLLSVPWRSRHTAALTEDRQLVLKMIEEADEPNPDRLADRRRPSAVRRVPRPGLVLGNNDARRVRRTR